MDTIDSEKEAIMPEELTSDSASSKHIVISKQMLIGIGVAAFIVGGLVTSYLSKYDVGLKIQPKEATPISRKVAEMKKEDTSDVAQKKGIMSPYLNYGHFIGVRGLQNVNPALTLADPTAVVLRIQHPNGDVTTPTPTRESTGIYTYDLTLAAVGTYAFQWVGSGDVIATGDSIVRSLANPF